ncbi:MAG TPA: M28 family peptidase, partial [Planctomycetota bacterium]|nr:M28 family peptidase [Planctomycetota bacterium]
MSRVPFPLVVALFAASCATDAGAPETRPASRPVDEGPPAGVSPTLAPLLRRAFAEIERLASPKEIQESLKALTARPNLAGSPAAAAATRFVESRFMLAGLETRVEEFQPLVPYPVECTVELLRPYAYRAPMVEQPLDRDFDTHSGELLPPYLAYAADGDVQGGVVYAHYGRAEDFDRLEAAGVDVRGRIVVARYGKTYRGAKVTEAARRGAIAAVLYSDPQDDGFARGPEHPEGPWRPKSAVQRGSALDLSRRPGDPLTPDAPADAMALRLALEEAETLQPIPAVALSWGDVEPILKALDGLPAPEGWQGAMPFAYRLGGGKAAAARVALRSDWRRRPIRNVVGLLRGAVWPEETVMIGCHRDAWCHGAVDPGGGQAAMLEAARLLGALARAGLRPSRSVAFCSWDGEEFGLLGSTEHVEGARARLLETCVLYLNADAAVSGDRFGASASPELRPLVRATLSGLGAGEGGDLWRTTAPTGAVRFALPGGGSDHVPFVHQIGAPWAEFGSSGPYGVYHSLYDTFGWMKRHGDPD